MDKTEITLDDLFEAKDETFAAIAANPQLLRSLLIRTPPPDQKLIAKVKDVDLDSLDFDISKKIETTPDAYLWGALDPRLRTGLEEFARYISTQPEPFRIYSRVLRSLKNAYEAIDEDNTSIRKGMGEGISALAELFGDIEKFLNADTPIIAYSYLICLAGKLHPEIEEILGAEEVKEAQADLLFDLFELAEATTLKEYEFAAQCEQASETWYLCQREQAAHDVIDQLAKQERQANPNHHNDHDRPAGDSGAGGIVPPNQD